MADTVRLSSPSSLHYSSKYIVFEDHFYVFSPRETAPHHIAEKDLTPEYNGVETILGERHGSPVVELASEKSGLKLAFDTNRALSLV